MQKPLQKINLKQLGYRIIGGKGDGYDLVVEREGETLYIEVKGRKHFEDVELREKQARKALDEKEKYCILVVYNIPNNPEAYILRNPAEKGEITATILLKASLIQADCVIT